MDDQLIDDLIQSDVIISKTIEEGNKSLETSVDDILSSVMSSSAKSIEKEVLNQSIKQAQSVKESLSGSINNNFTIPEIAELESAKSENSVSEKTLSNLNDVMSNLEGVLKDMNTNQQTATTKTTTTEPTELTSTVIAEQEGTKTTIEKTPQEFDIDKLSNLIKDFKTISTFDWSAKWLSNVEKVTKEISNIKDELKSLPEESKINLGVDEESIENVEKGLEKVKENISAESGTEGGATEESTTGMSVSFLDGFNGFLQNLIGLPTQNAPMGEEQPTSLEFMEMPESREISFDQQSNFLFSEEEFGGGSAPTTLRETPQNITQETSATRIEEERPAPLESIEMPDSREISFDQQSNFLFSEEEFGGGSASNISRETSATRVEENRPTELNQPILVENKVSGEVPISEEEFDLEEEEFKETPPPPPPPRSSTDSGKSIGELFKMAYAYKIEPEEEELSEEDELLSNVTNPKLPTEKEIKGGVETKVESKEEPPLIESLEGLMATETPMAMPPTTATTEAISKGAMPPGMAEMPTESPLGFKSMRIEDIAKEASKMPPSPAERSMRIEAMPPMQPEMPMESPLGFKSMRIEDIAKEASKMPPSPAERSMRIEAMPPGMAEMPTESPLGFKSMRIEDIAKEASKMPPGMAEMPTESPFGFKSMRIEDIAKEAETREKEKGSTLNLAQPPLELSMGLEGMGEMEGMPLPPPIPMAEGMIPPMLPNMMGGMPNMPMPPQQAVGSKEIARPQQNLGAILNETIPFGADLLGIPPMPMPPMGKEGEDRSVSLESMDMLKIPDFFEFIGGGQMPLETTTGVSNKPEMPPMLNTGMEDILIKNQSQKSPELSSAISKIKSVEAESAKSVVAESEAMMGEVNLEPLGEKLSSSIDSLGSSMASEKTSTESPTGEGAMSGDVMSNLTSVLQRIEEKLGGQPSEQVAGQPSVSSGGGGGISEAQARIIGRQIANELKNSLAKLYN